MTAGVQTRFAGFTRHWPLLAALALGLLVTPQFGESWDELKFYKYADGALQAYGTWPRTGDMPVTGNTYDNYGPVYVMAVSLGARALGLILPWIESDLRHLLYFVTFLAGVWAFYTLCRRWLSSVAALGATLLFATQPVLLGHAFISPKDVPFLSFFLLSLVSGFNMVDGFRPLDADSPGAQNRRRLVWLTALWLLFVLACFGGTRLVHDLLEGAIRAAAAGQTNVLSWLASDIRTADPEIYIRKYFTLFIRVRALVFWPGTGLLAWAYHRRMPVAYRFLRNVLPSAIFLGLTTCIRVLGPLAGLIVGLYAWNRLGRRALPMLLVYAFAALVAMYATWPYLWPDPAGRFLESVVVMARYPWRGQVLFDGVLYESTAIPRSYLPALLGIQLTEPVWALWAAGLAVTAYGAVRRRVESRQLLILTLLWFVVPLSALVALRSPLYDNFRQVFFILPPVFILVGVLFERIEQPTWRMAVIALSLLPGIVGGLRLHPYEYIYYNSYAGGVSGAFRRFELDYWGTSYREAAEHLNVFAPEAATIWVEGPAHLLQLYLRPDLEAYSTYEAERAQHYDCVVATSRYDLDLSSYPEAPVIYRVERDGVPLAVIKEPAGRFCLFERGKTYREQQ